MIYNLLTTPKAVLLLFLLPLNVIAYDDTKEPEDMTESDGHPELYFNFDLGKNMCHKEHTDGFGRDTLSGTIYRVEEEMKYLLLYELLI
jgi:hypothetical protein